MADAKSKNNIGIEGHIKNNNQPRSILNNGSQSFYKLWFYIKSYPIKALHISLAY